MMYRAKRARHIQIERGGRRKDCIKSEGKRLIEVSVIEV